MRRTLGLFVLIVLLVSISQVQAQVAYSGQSAAVALGGSRTVPLTIKIVFIGFLPTDINTTYLKSRINLPDQKPQAVLASSQTTGAVNFNFTYQPVFATGADLTNLAIYMTSIQKSVVTAAGPPGTTNPPQNPYFNDSTTNIGTVDNVFYDANKVESWLNNQSYAANPVPGYTLFIADLHAQLPSLSYTEYQAYHCKPNCNNPRTVTAQVHYYNTTVTDPDLGLVQPRHYMTGWGGDNRSYFIDLSAGISYWTAEPPIQVAQQIRGVSAASNYALPWRTQFVADYITGAVYNLFGPDQLYPVQYSAKYVFHLFVIDARTPSEIAAGPTIMSTVNVPAIKAQLQSLVPFATVEVTPVYETLSSVLGLSEVVSNATTNVYDPAANTTVVDAKLVYNWLSIEGHVSQFLTPSRTTGQIDIPEFIFAFSGNHDFAFTYKGDVFMSPVDSIFGVSLGDMVLISHSQRDLNEGFEYTGTGSIQPGRGLGFTRTIIHESGHELGLVHPFDYDIDEDFVNSIMAYYPNANVYSQFDKDLELRAINDELLIYAQVTIASAGSSLLNSGTITAAQTAMATAEQKYNAMDYAGAVSYSLAAAQDAANAQTSGTNIFGGFGAVLYVVLGVLVGAAIGLVLGFLIFRKRTTGGLAYYRCPTCNRALRWDPAMARWYCDYCQKPV
jgi:hypothetical protein